MEKEEVKNILRKAYAAKCSVKSVEYKIKELESLRERITPTYSKAPGGGGSGNKVEDITIEIFEMQVKLKNKIRAYLEDVALAERLIDRVEEKDILLSTVLRQRYILGYGWKKIAYTNHYSDRQMINLHNKAIEYIAENINDIE